MELRAVLFDAGHTLIYIDPVRVVGLLDAAGVSVDLETFRTAEVEARRALQEHVHAGHTGTEPEVWRPYFAALLAGVGVSGERMQDVTERIRREHARAHLWTYPAPGTQDVLRQLSDEGYRLAVISNADGRVRSVLEQVGLAPFFEFVLDSADVGIEKPDAGIFREACRRLDLAPASCLYIGDLLPVDIVGARGAGLQALLLDPLGVHRGDAEVLADLRELPHWLRSRRVGLNRDS